ncbi:hypothetical protein FACS189487_06940 [Campylobacterota bacterium]|nr:hypothetical protein FACS189487_06940 [Campylobacterota bacterium]
MAGNLKSTRFSLWANFKNSMRGFIEVSRHENPMKAELAAFAVGTLILIFWDIGFVCRVVLLVSMLFVIFAELANSAIERVVDLVTLEYHDLAKAAKDAASACVLFALLIAGIAWASVFYIVYFGG